MQLKDNIVLFFYQNVCRLEEETVFGLFVYWVIKKNYVILFRYVISKLCIYSMNK